MLCFNTQPPEGGWISNISRPHPLNGFNTQPPEGGWEWILFIWHAEHGFNTQPPEGGWWPKNPNRSPFMTFQHTAA